ncbi:MAG: MAPEG family protein [Alphaproteobacteria bacterium]
MLIVELQVLGLAALLWVIQLAVAAVAANRQIGPDYLMGPRDEGKPLAGRPARLKRALDNHGEGLLLFTIAVLLVALGEASNAVTTLAAWVYLAARVVYVPAYALGWTPWRSLIWTVGFVASLVLLLVGLFA